ncbi:cytosolic carboxypeptidase-like protein 5 isoform X2 [Eriocheir sinensis]|uniref:cytosolic carboxypeptidase-like protein 5 isoform X2 n=1 Tax=Eriocheir sinensis TaxID=95602 RepID=UPI0021C59761|nr:cytosolic carboxypeptidase-like protein 5 isoform X2 [Eriocheir sinensis]
MEETVGPFTFTSNFECGNLARAERVDSPGSGQGSSLGGSRKTQKAAASSSSSSSSCQPTVEPLPVNYEYNLWTRPDCSGTEYENNNRTWFFFGIRGGSVGNRVRLNVMNLNKQTKLFSQGMQPVVQCVSSARPPRWERIKEKCTYRSEESSTVISWVHTVSDAAATTHYAFTYPYTYSEVQAVLEGLDRRFPAGCTTLYYHRELLAYSLDRWRVDLLTVSSHSGRAEEREDRLPGLFPVPSQLRPHRFPGKKVVFISARVHPGETSSSFVLNGFLNFIVSGDPRAERLRDMFVFKLIPLLNPDGVVRGHYRTDQRGVNLNRVYIDPSPVLHPTIHAARQVILYHHHGHLSPSSSETSPSLSTMTSDSTDPSATATTTSTSDSTEGTCSSMGESKGPAVVVMDEDTCHSFSDVQSGRAGGEGGGGRVRGVSLMELDEPSASGWDISNSVASTSLPRGAAADLHDDCSNVSGISEAETGVTAMFGSMSAVSDFSNLLPGGASGDMAVSPGKKAGVGGGSKSRDLFLKDFHKEEMLARLAGREGCGVASSSESEAECGRPGRESEGLGRGCLAAPLHLGTEEFPPTLAPPTPVPEETKVTSGLFLYVDLHGHASKKGIFIYGNWYEDPAVMVENMLFPKLLGINCPNFDFSACNFSERNMYLKDRRDGMSKEGSGRVAIMRATGLLRSYTLECNYNTGRTHNPTPPSPLDHKKSPPGPLNTPPKYTPAVFEDCGRQLGVSLLDLVNGGSEWSRVPQSQYGSLTGVRTWLHHFLTSSALSPRNQLAGQQIPRAYTSRTSNKLSVERITGARAAASGPRLGPNRQGPPSTPASPRLPRTRGQRVRRHSWCLTVDAENQEPREASEGPARPRPTSAKKPTTPGGLSPRCKPKSQKLKAPSPIKTGVSRSLTFTDLGESSHISAESKMASSKMTSNKHSLTASVSLTPNLNVKLSISDTPESPKLVKKVEKIRRQRSKGLASSTKKLKVCPSSSSSTEESSLKAKEPSFYNLPSLETSDRKCNPLSPSQEGFYATSQSPLSPRSPLSSVCEPQASQSSPGLSIITTAASCDLYVQPKSPAVVPTTKKVAKVLSSPSKRSSKHTLKSLSKSMDRLPAVAGAAGERLKLLPKKVKKVSARSVTDLPGTITSQAIKPATSQPTLGWIITEPPQTLAPDLEPDPPKLKKRKKSSRKSL